VKSYLPSVASRTICNAFWLSSSGVSLDHAMSWCWKYTEPETVCTDTVFLFLSTLMTTYRPTGSLPGTRTTSFTLGVYFAISKVSHKAWARFQPCENQTAPVPTFWGAMITD